MDNNYDIVIIGGGIAGLSIANSLKKTPLKILLLERKPKYIDVNRGDTLYPHSLDILEKWNVLQNIMDKGAVKSDKISIFQENKDFADLNIISPTRTKNNFLLSLNHELIEQSLYESLQGFQNITVFLGSNAVEIVENNGVYTTIKYKLGGEDKIANAKLFIAGDGKDSFMRKAAGINYETTDFDHDIVILTSSAPETYNFHTWFFYGKNHEMIIGPLPQNKVRLSLIVKRDESKSWMMMNQADISRNVQSESDILKNCTIEKSESHLYEIKMSLAEKFYKNNLIFIGDSAHTVHPISGQGMALAISDADVLSDLITKNQVDYLKTASEFGESRREIVKNLQEHVSNLGNLLVSEDKLVDMARIFLINNLETIPMFERQVEAMLQSEIEKF